MNSANRAGDKAIQEFRDDLCQRIAMFAAEIGKSQSWLMTMKGDRSDPEIFAKAVARAAAGLALNAAALRIYTGALKAFDDAPGADSLLDRLLRLNLYVLDGITRIDGGDESADLFADSYAADVARAERAHYQTLRQMTRARS